MSCQFISIHPDNPQKRLIKQAVEIINAGAVAVVPTECAYSLICAMGHKSAIEKIAKIRQISKNHNFTLLCKDLSEASIYARIDNSIFRAIKNNTPGAYTFILPATKEVPRRLMNEKRRTVGIRIPNGAIICDLLEQMHEPLLSCSLILPDNDNPLYDPVEINNQIGSLVDLIIDGGCTESQATTVLEYHEGVLNINRVGLGDPRPFEN